MLFPSQRLYISSNKALSCRKPRHCPCAMSLPCPFYPSAFLTAHAELDVRFTARRDIRIVPTSAYCESEGHGKKVVEVKRPLVGQQITILHVVSHIPSSKESGLKYITLPIAYSITRHKFRIVMKTLAAYRKQMYFFQGISAAAAEGTALSLRCQILATTTKNAKIKICKTNPARIMFSPRLKPSASLA
jgi:hypothetical protein